MRYLRSATWSKISLIAVIMAWALSAQAADGISYKAKGFIFGRAYQDVEDDTPFEKQEDLEMRARLENELTLSRWNTRVFLSAEARGEALFNDKTAKDADFLLREAYLELKSASSAFAIGRQVVTWGKLDDIVLLDRVNPQDYLRFIMYNKQERKEPVFMFRYDYFGNGFDVETVFLPEFRASNVNYFGSDWAVYDHLLQEIDAGAYPEATKATVRKIRSQGKPAPSSGSLKNAQGGLRVRTRAKDVDWGFYYMNLLHSIATLHEQNPGGLAVKKFLNFPTLDNLAALINSAPNDDALALEEEHPRMHMLGFDWETVAGEWGVRGEAGYFIAHPYLRDDMSYTERDTLITGIGADYTSANNFSVNLQFIETYIVNYKPLFPEEEFGHQGTATLAKDFLRGNLNCSLKHTFNISYHDWMLNPKLTYKFGNGLEVSLSGFIFEGAPSTIFGRYSSQDTVFLETKLHF